MFRRLSPFNLSTSDREHKTPEVQQNMNMSPKKTKLIHMGDVPPGIVDPGITRTSDHSPRHRLLNIISISFYLTAIPH